MYLYTLPLPVHQLGSHCIHADRLVPADTVAFSWRDKCVHWSRCAPTVRIIPTGYLEPPLNQRRRLEERKKISNA